MKKSKMLILALTALAIIIRIGSNMKEYESEEIVVADATATKTETEVISESTNIIDDINENVKFPTIDWEYLQAINSNVVGWIYIPSVGINYPVVQGEDNEYYLNHNLEGKYSSHGCIMLDSEADTNLSLLNTFIYGHNMKDGTMFHGIKDMMQGDKIYYLTPANTYEIEVFATMNTIAGSDVYRTFTEESAYEEYIEYISSITGIYKQVQGNIVSLSTCTGVSGSSNRFVVMGELINITAN